MGNFIGDNYIYIIEGLTFGAIILMALYFMYSFGAFKKD